MTHTILTVAVNAELDIVAARQRARQIAFLSGLTPRDQARISTAVSELARNIINRSGTGTVSFGLAYSSTPQMLLVSVAEPAAGALLAADTAGVRRLIGQCDISIDDAGCSLIVMHMPIAPDAQRLTLSAIEAFSRQLEDLPSNVVLSAVQGQNKELSSTVDALREKQQELVSLAETLESSHTDVLALNASLDEKATTLERADLRKDEFLAILSHELRGPLSTVGMAAQMLESSTLPAERQSQMAQLISRQVMHMTRLVEDLLDVSRISSGLMSLNKVPVDMREVVQFAIEQHIAEATARQHSIAFTPPAHPCIVSGEAVRLVQVVGNVLANAIRYTPAGGAITLSLASNDGMVGVDIADNGIGLAPELLASLFDLYVQAQPTSGRGTSGLGLGLALVKSLLEAHGGAVSAASAGVGHGSTFSIRLPVDPST